jgi:hypothetical protein
LETTEVAVVEASSARVVDTISMVTILAQVAITTDATTTMAAVEAAMAAVVVAEAAMEAMEVATEAKVGEAMEMVAAVEDMGTEAAVEDITK